MEQIYTVLFVLLAALKERKIKMILKNLNVINAGMNIWQKQNRNGMKIIALHIGNQIVLNVII